jgi:hypothetical protein
MDESRSYFRSMIPDTDDLPTIGRSRRRLAACVPPDPQPDIVPDAAPYVHPTSGGMSVAPDSVWNLPHHRRPRYLGKGSSGPPGDRVYFVREATLPAPLSIRHDKPLHALIEPASTMPLSHYEAALTWNPWP